MSTKVNLVPDENGNDPFVQISGTNIMQPVDIQGITYKDASGNDSLPVQLTGSNVPDTQRLPVKLLSGGAEAYIGVPLRQAAAAGNGMWTWASMLAHNGSSEDAWRNNTQGTLLASAARTAAPSIANQTNYNAKGVQITLNVTVASGTGGLQVLIQVIDPVTGSSYSMNVTPTAVTATGEYIYELYPGISGTSGFVNQRTSGVLPRTWKVSVLHGDGTSYTYSLGYALIL